MAVVVKWVTAPAPHRPTVVLIHGGQRPARVPVRHLDVRYARMTPFALAMRRRWGAEVAVGQVYNPAGGWLNATSLRALREAIGGIPTPAERIVLVGHSSGGWAALVTGGGYAGVVALAPWVSSDMPVAALGTTPVAIAHGERDRVTSPARSAAFVQRLHNAGAPATFTLMPGAGHAMLAPASPWHRFVTDNAARMLGLA